MSTSQNKSVRYRNRQKEKAVEFFGGKCTRCGYNRSFAALEFHHRIPSEKKFNPTRVMSYKWDIILEELSKCDLLCSNCHKEEHSGITEYNLQRNKRVDTQCPTCSKLFRTVRPNQKYCSVICYNNTRKTN